MKVIRKNLNIRKISIWFQAIPLKNNSQIHPVLRNLLQVRTSKFKMWRIQRKRKKVVRINNLLTLFQVKIIRKKKNSQKNLRYQLTKTSLKTHQHSRHYKFVLCHHEGKRKDSYIAAR